MRLPEGYEAEVAPGALIGGELRRLVLEHDHMAERNRYADPDFYIRVVIALVSLFLVGLALHALTPAMLDARLETGRDFGRSLGYGLLAFFGTPVALVLLAFTLVGIPIAVIGLFVYLTTLFISVIVVGAVVGAALVKSERSTTTGFGLQLLAGLGVLMLLAMLPWVGRLFLFVIVVTGLGLLAERAVEGVRSRRQRLVT